MKKFSFTTLMFSSLAVLSMASYLFLSSVAKDSQGVDFANHKPATEMDEQGEPRRVLLPDVTLAKRLINITKIVLPRD